MTLFIRSAQIKMYYSCSVNRNDGIRTCCFLALAPESVIILSFILKYTYSIMHRCGNGCAIYLFARSIGKNLSRGNESLRLTRNIDLVKAEE